jgi:hypothetical protein
MFALTMPRPVHVRVAAVGVLLAACGSSGTSDLFGVPAAAAGGQVAATTGDAAGGATTGAGGTMGGTSAGGTAAGASPGAGGASGPADGGADGGGIDAPDSGGTSRGGAHDSGEKPSGPLDASVIVFVPGGIISSQCAACANANCQPEEAVCHADPACMQVYSCVTSCIIPLQCAACVVGSGSGPQEFNTLQCCTSHHCIGLCPSLNAGVLGCP